MTHDKDAEIARLKSEVERLEKENGIYKALCRVHDSSTIPSKCIHELRADEAERLMTVRGDEYSNFQDEMEKLEKENERMREHVCYCCREGSCGEDCSCYRAKQALTGEGERK